MTTVALRPRKSGHGVGACECGLAKPSPGQYIVLEQNEWSVLSLVEEFLPPECCPEDFKKANKAAKLSKIDKRACAALVHPLTLCTTLHVLEVQWCWLIFVCVDLGVWLCTQCCNGWSSSACSAKHPMAKHPGGGGLAQMGGLTLCQRRLGAGRILLHTGSLCVSTIHLAAYMTNILQCNSFVFDSVRKIMSPGWVVQTFNILRGVPP